jgi:hypothetical protein
MADKEDNDVALLEAQDFVQVVLTFHSVQWFAARRRARELDSTRERANWTQHESAPLDVTLLNLAPKQGDIDVQRSTSVVDAVVPPVLPELPRTRTAAE